MSSKSRKRNCGRTMNQAKTSCGKEARILAGAVGKPHRGCGLKTCRWS